MQIHVVSPGQTLTGIAAAYSTTVEAVVRANRIPDPSRLVPGQALVIPIQGRYYWVRRGDTLTTIARRFGIPVLRIAEANRIPLNALLTPGMRLFIPSAPRRTAEINAYVEPLGREVPERLVADAREAAPSLTYLAPFSYRARRDGTLQAPPLDDFPNIARQNRASLMMVVTNLEGDRFSDELGHILVTDENVQTRLLNEIVSTARQIGFRDVHFDFEFLPPEDREAYNRFLRRARDRLHAEGLLISTALAPKTSRTQRGQWYEAHDYRAHGQIVDFVVLMTYEWGYSGGPPLPVSPINEVRRVLDYAVTEIPRNKIMMGQNLYGYDWTLPFRPGNPPARAVSPQEAIRIAAREGAAIQYDTRAQAPHFRYTDDRGRSHQVWFEDARSIQAKFDLVKRMGLRGISYWKLGLSFPQNWLLIGENFQVVKRG
ncbi:glycoside hydrolase family 18 protein [Staphylospora marina]|uniref:glycoside hydrolase family 18 protein n=1 Tax=Staphylospora marina TaxID=2490858 RepID=UPI000F5BF325|nr:glycoside hydrolase family 18 protein [Staphylospora marina]